MAGEYVEICNMSDVKNCYGEKQKQGKRNGAVHQKKKRESGPKWIKLEIREVTTNIIEIQTIITEY